MKSKLWLLLLILCIGAYYLCSKYCCTPVPPASGPATTSIDTTSLGTALPFSLIQNRIIDLEISLLQKSLATNPKDALILSMIKELESNKTDSGSNSTECTDSIKVKYAICVNCPKMANDTTSTILSFVNCCPQKPNKPSANPKENPVWISPKPLPFPDNLKKVYGANCYVYGPIPNSFELDLPSMVGGPKQTYKLLFTNEGVSLK